MAITHTTTNILGYIVTSFNENVELVPINKGCKTIAFRGGVVYTVKMVKKKFILSYNNHSSNESDVIKRETSEKRRRVKLILNDINTHRDTVNGLVKQIFNSDSSDILEDIAFHGGIVRQHISSLQEPGFLTSIVEVTDTVRQLVITLNPGKLTRVTTLNKSNDYIDVLWTPCSKTDLKPVETTEEVVSSSLIQVDVGLRISDELNKVLSNCLE
jgi:hypothetical protein